MAKKLATKVEHDELDALLGDRVPNNSYPYPSGSDLLELWLWQQRIELRIQETRPATEYEHWLYLPHELADSARARLSVKYPLIFKRVDELLDSARQADRDFVDGRASESDLFNAMGSLSGKIETAIKIVADDRDPLDGIQTKSIVTLGDHPQIVLEDGNPIALDYETAVWLKTLIDCGDWMSDPEYRVKHGSENDRPDRWRKKLPQVVLARIQTDRRKGSRWRLA